MLVSLSLAKQRTPDEIKSLPEFSRQSADEAYRITDRLYVDNVDGMGATPDNQNVMYKGFVGELPLKLFIDMALASGDRVERSGPLKEKMLAGYGIGSPCFYIDVRPYMTEGDGKAVITGHEGRARVTALQELGVSSMPIQFFITGYRSRHIREVADFMYWLNEGLVDERGNIHKHVFKKITVG